MASPNPYRAVPGGVRVRVRLSPKAAANRLGGIFDNGNGERALKAAVTAAPEGGKANRALIKMLAREWRLPKTGMSIAAGAARRNKTLFIEGDAEMILARLRGWAEKGNG